MDLEKLVEKLKELIISEIKEEFKEFKATVSGQLEGFRLAIESMNARMTNLEGEVRDLRRALDETNKRIDETNKRIDETNKRIDETNKRLEEFKDDTLKRFDTLRSETIKLYNELRSELKGEIIANTLRIDETNKRIDETNKRLDDLFLEVAKIRSDLSQALSQKGVIEDMLTRIQRLEAQVLKAA
ncbi:MAG: hypothetical protein ABWJ99_07975 [Caldimicrobium sp.]